MASAFFADEIRRQRKAPTKARVLLVEGSDDGYFFCQLLTDLGADPSNTEIVALGGKDNLAAEINQFLKSAAFVSQQIKRYAIVRDADDRPANAVREIHGILTAHGEPNPVHGTFLPATTPHQHEVGMYILPSDLRSGDLDLVCLETVPVDPAIQCVSAYMNCIPRLPVGLTLPHKREVQVFLAGKEELCRGSGMGLQKGYFDKRHPSLDPIKAFLRAFIV